jgi:hypothetical protein
MFQKKVVALRQAYVNPSIGKIGKLTYDERSQRHKVFCANIFKNRASLIATVKPMHDTIQSSTATRFTGRFFVRKNVNLSQIGISIEATIPITEDLNLVYLGFNKEERRTEAGIKQRIEQMKAEVIGSKRKRVGDLPAGYTIATTISETDIPAILKLYQGKFTSYPIEFNEDVVRNMISNSKFYGVKNKEGQIVSTCVAEEAYIDIDNKQIKFVELSEMATLKQEGRQGLSSILTNALIDKLQEEQGSTIIYGEARAYWEPINRIFHKLGFKCAGTLEQHCMISGCTDEQITNTSDYENLNVWYLPMEA